MALAWSTIQALAGCHACTYSACSHWWGHLRANAGALGTTWPGRAAQPHGISRPKIYGAGKHYECKHDECKP